MKSTVATAMKETETTVQSNETSYLKLATNESLAENNTEQPASKKKSTIYTRDILLVLAAAFFYMGSPQMVTTLVSGFAESLGSGGNVMGLIGGLMSLSSLVFRPLAGNLTDVLSKYKLAMLGSACMFFACVGYIFAPNPTVIVIARILNGLGFACCSVCLSTWVADMLPPDKLGAGMGVYGTINALAMAVSPTIGLKVFNAFGYRASFVVAALFMLATFIIVQFVRDKGEVPAAIKAQNAGSKKFNFKIVDKNVLHIAIIVMLLGIPYCATQSFLLTYINTRGINANPSLYFPVYAVVLVVLRFGMKDLFDRLSMGYFVAMGAVCAAMSMICLTVMQGNLGLILGAAFMAGGFGIMCSVSQANAIMLAGEGKRGLANSTYYVGFDAGLGLGPLVGGVLYANTDIQLFYPILLVTVPLFVIVFVVKRQQLKKERIKKEKLKLAYAKR